MSADDDYEMAKCDPLATLILDALHKQDAATWNGGAGNIGRLALDTAAAVRDWLRSCPITDAEIETARKAMLAINVTQTDETYARWAEEGISHDARLARAALEAVQVERWGTDA